MFGYVVWVSELKVLHSDNHLLGVLKPAGVPIVPDSSGDRSLLEMAKDWVKVEFNKPGEVFLGVVHRLDRPVSGVVLFARTSKAAARLSESWRKNEVEKYYWAIGNGTIDADSGELTQHLFKDRDRNQVRIVGEGFEGAKLARTCWKILGREKGRVFLEMEPITGRSHQLRIAARHLGATLLGDLKYGSEQALSDRSIALHAWRLNVPHPTREERVEIIAPPSEVFRRLWKV